MNPASKKVSILIPCYNEEATIEELLRRVEAADFGAWEKEIIVVDDGSKDGTRLLLEKYRNRPKYQIIFHEKNQGKGGAERTGIAVASGDYIVLQDADLEYDPREIKKMLDVVDRTGAPVVFGSRNLGGSWQRAFSGFFLVSLGVWWCAKVVNLLYGTRLTDSWTCYKLFSREVARRAKFIGNGFEADYLFIGEVAVEGFPIVEVPISHAPRTVAEGKKIRYRDGLNSLVLILKHRFLNLNRKYAANSTKDSKDRLQTIQGFIVCPLCQSPLTPKSSGFTCPKDGLFEKNARGVPLFIEAGLFSEHQVELDRGINWLKSFLKQFPALYYAIWNIFCPVLQAYNGPKKIFKEIPKGGIILDVGSGPYRWDRRCVNVDVFPFPEVDLVADAEHLPFPNASVDAVVSESLLEHVNNPDAVAREMLRVVKSGGVIYASAPFLTPYHASPDDFSRWTTSGLRTLFAGAEIIETGVRSGPWSALLVFLAYWLGVVFAFGSKKAAPFLAFVFMLVLGPLKIFDLFFAKLPGSETVSAQLYILCRKK